MSEKVTAIEASKKRTQRLYLLWLRGGIQVKDAIALAFMAGVRHQANKRNP